MPRVKNTATAYGWPAKALHWIMALLVIGLFALGYWMRTLGYYDPWYQRAPELHKSLGVILAALLLLRIVWRLLNQQPPALGGNALEHVIAAVTHLAFYILLIGMAISGYLFATGDGKPLSFFGLFDIAPLINSKPLADRAGEIHWWLAYSVIGLALLHIAGALKHHFVDKDDTLRRMSTRKLPARQ